MATFSLAQGVLTEEWHSTPGLGGIRGWACRGLCLDTQAAYFELTRGQIVRYRFVEVPYRWEVVIIPLDGTATPLTQTIDIRMGPITATNTAPSRFVLNCVKLGPVLFANYAPLQQGGTYSGYSITSYEVTFQPLRV